MTFVRAQIRRRAGMGDFWDASNWPKWLSNSTWASWMGGPQIVPPTDQQKTDLANAAVRAYGIDPATGKPIAPQYAAGIADRLHLDPNDPVAMQAAVNKVKADELARVASDFAKFKAEQEAANKPSIPWGAIALGVGGLLVGGYVAVKAFK